MTRSDFRRRHIVRALACALLPAWLSATGQLAAAPPTVTSLLRLGYDSNPLGGAAATRPAINDAGSFTAAAAVTITQTFSGAPADPSPAASLKLTYTGELLRFDSASTEDASTHRLAAAGAFTAAGWQISGDASSLFVDGSRDTFASTAAVNANGMTLWRERREQWQHRAKLQAQTATGDALLLRATARLLACDYRTRALAGRVAFADRSEVVAGLDAGWKQSATSTWLLGARLGQQEQATVPLPNCEFDYSNTFTRLVASWEGKLSPTTTASLAAGPDFRRYSGAIDPRVFTGGRDRTSFWGEAALTTKPAAAFAITAKAARFVWLSSNGKAAYVDTSLDATATWSASKRLDLQAGAKLHQCDYFPSARDDWESLLTAALTFKTTARTQVTLELVRHQGWNALDAFPDRAFHRFSATVGATWRL